MATHLSYSPLARRVPGVRDPLTKGINPRKPWGYLLHTTGSGVTAQAKKKWRGLSTPLEVALAIYIDYQNGAAGYPWGGPGYVIDHDGGIHQIAPDEARTEHAGSNNRALYRSGEWTRLVSAETAAQWHKRWPGRKHPYSMFPSVSPNIDYCLDAGTRVLTGDLRWVPIGDIKVGERLIGFGEELRAHNVTERADVTYVAAVTKPRVRVITTHGELVCSADHMFVGKLGQAGSAEWLRADRLRPGSALRHYATPWETDTTNDGGWLTGMLDGEGHWSRSGELIVSQNVGPVLDRVLSVLAAKGIPFNVRSRERDRVCQVSLQGAGTGLAHVGRFRPTRMLGKAEAQWLGRRVYGKSTEKPFVLAVESIPDGEVIAIKTTSRTFIAEGFLSHNCGVEMIPIGDGFGGQPMRPGLRFTQAQHDAAIALGRDLGCRHGWPADWANTGRLLGHEDVDPIVRSDAHGGWDPGAMRTLPYFDFQYVKQGIAAP